MWAHLFFSLEFTDHSILGFLFFLLFLYEKEVLESHRELSVLRREIDALRKEFDVFRQMLHGLREAVGEVHGLRGLEGEWKQFREDNQNVLIICSTFYLCFVFALKDTDG